MPGLNGIEVLGRLRALRPELPVIFLTVLGEQVFEEAALLGGAVDFVEKSRGFTILERRIRIILGRVPVTGVAGADDRIVIGDLILDSKSRRAILRGRVVDLTVTEFAMVLALAGKAGRDVGFRQLYDAGRGRAEGRRRTRWLPRQRAGRHQAHPGQVQRSRSSLRPDRRLSGVRLQLAGGPWVKSLSAAFAPSRSS
ncbi:response regulator transcription factor [Magnetospirillum molischianum]|uniref:Putative two-component response transcriptional regulator (CheY family) n=1 Tax=Magnetospirillum molischianum DSM 120 TaxID=1150626 RepID=H8FVC4_MAGML|nr:response regulator [Magnetospirillum molischianum]CCG42312.1 Putative two-component response transcriptional regulator (CheY family) [Magnetospirillum molischianum DSM 120]